TRQLVKRDSRLAVEQVGQCLAGGAEPGLGADMVHVMGPDRAVLVDTGPNAQTRSPTRLADVSPPGIDITNIGGRDDDGAVATQYVQHRVSPRPTHSNHPRISCLS